MVFLHNVIGNVVATEINLLLSLNKRLCSGEGEGKNQLFYTYYSFEQFLDFPSDLRNETVAIIMNSNKRIQSVEMVGGVTEKYVGN